jgi:hypothetical protein
MDLVDLLNNTSDAAGVTEQKDIFILIRMEDRFTVAGVN